MSRQWGTEDQASLMASVQGDCLAVQQTLPPSSAASPLTAGRLLLNRHAVHAVRHLRIAVAGGRHRQPCIEAALHLTERIAAENCVQAHDMRKHDVLHPDTPALRWPHPPSPELGLPRDRVVLPGAAIKLRVLGLLGPLSPLCRLCIQELLLPPPPPDSSSAKVPSSLSASSPSTSVPSSAPSSAEWKAGLSSCTATSTEALAHAAARGARQGMCLHVGEMLPPRCQHACRRHTLNLTSTLIWPHPLAQLCTIHPK